MIEVDFGDVGSMDHLYDVSKIPGRDAKPGSGSRTWATTSRPCLQAGQSSESLFWSGPGAFCGAESQCEVCVVSLPAMSSLARGSLWFRSRFAMKP